MLIIHFSISQVKLQFLSIAHSLSKHKSDQPSTGSLLGLLNDSNDPVFTFRLNKLSTAKIITLHLSYRILYTPASILSFLGFTSL